MTDTHTRFGRTAIAAALVYVTGFSGIGLHLGHVMACGFVLFIVLSPELNAALDWLTGKDTQTRHANPTRGPGDG